MSGDKGQLATGDASAFGFRLQSVTFSDGSTLPLPSVGVVLIVGPNNSGKSQALSDIAAHIGAQSGVRGMPWSNCGWLLSSDQAQLRGQRDLFGVLKSGVLEPRGHFRSLPVAGARIKCH